MKMINLTFLTLAIHPYLEVRAGDIGVSVRHLFTNEPLLQTALNVEAGVFRRPVVFDGATLDFLHWFRLTHWGSDLLKNTFQLELLTEILQYTIGCWWEFLQSSISERFFGIIIAWKRCHLATETLHSHNAEVCFESLLSGGGFWFGRFSKSLCNLYIDLRSP